MTSSVLNIYFVHEYVIKISADNIIFINCLTTIKSKYFFLTCMRMICLGLREFSVCFYVECFQCFINLKITQIVCHVIAQDVIKKRLGVLLMSEIVNNLE